MDDLRCASTFAEALPSLPLSYVLRHAMATVLLVVVPALMYAAPPLSCTLSLVSLQHTRDTEEKHIFRTIVEI